MRFLIDTNLPPALAYWLIEAGHDADHVASILGPLADDKEIWSRAVATQAIVITKDSDYLDLANRTRGARVVLLRCGNLKLTVFKDWFELRQATIESLLENGEVVIEVR